MLLAIKNSQGILRLYVAPNLRERVDPVDKDYIDSIVQDLRERIQLDSDALFRHLSSLSVGPLRTLAVGSAIVERTYLAELCSSLVEL